MVFHSILELFYRKPSVETAEKQRRDFSYFPDNTPIAPLLLLKIILHAIETDLCRNIQWVWIAPFLIHRKCANLSADFANCNILSFHYRGFQQFCKAKKQAEPVLTSAAVRETPKFCPRGRFSTLCMKKAACAKSTGCGQHELILFYIWIHVLPCKPVSVLRLQADSVWAR